MLFGKKVGPTLGLDVNSSTISVIQIEKTKTDVKVSRFSSMPTPPDIVREGLLSDPEAVGTAVRELLDLVGIPNKKPIPIVNVGIPGQAVVIRLMPVPTGMPDDELNDVVQQEAINNLPFPLDEANVDYCLLPATERTDPDGVRRVDVLLAAIQRIVVDSYWRMADAADIQIGRLDISSLAVIRSLAAAGALKDDGQMTMCVNIRNDATDITLIKKGMPLFSRSVLLGVETLGEAISRSIDSPIDEAISLLPKIQLGSIPTSDPKLGQAAQVARSVFGDLTAEVGRSLEFYMSQVGAVQVDQVLLSGPGCVVPGVADFISNRLNIQAEIADPFQNLIYDKAQILEERLPVHSMLVGLVVDPATAALQTVQVDLNKQGRSTVTAGDGEAGDEGEAEEVDTPWFVPALGSGIALALVATLAWGVLVYYLSANKDTELATLEQSLTEKKSQLDQMTKQQDELAALKQKKDVLEKIVKHGTPRVAAMQVMRESIPEGVSLRTLKLTDGAVTATCAAVDFTKASHYAINLQGSNVLDEVHISDMHRQKKSPQTVVFAIDGVVKPELANMKVDVDAVPGAAAVPATAVKVILFVKSKDTACDQLKTALASIAEKYKDISVQPVDIADPANKQLIEKFAIKNAPDVYIVDAKGATLEHFPNVSVANLTMALDKASKLAQTTTTK